MHYQQLIEAVKLYDDMTIRSALDEIFASPESSKLVWDALALVKLPGIDGEMAMKLALVAHKLQIPLPEYASAPAAPVAANPPADPDDTTRIVYDEDPLKSPTAPADDDALPLLDDDGIHDADTVPVKPLTPIDPAGRIVHIISMERGLSNGTTGRHPQWTCRTNELEKPVWALDHPTNPERNSARIFFEAGYRANMQAMEVGDALFWKQHPIEVEVVKDGNFYRVVQVATRTDAMRPTEFPVTDEAKAQARYDAIMQARATLEKDELVVWDVETTGTGSTDEIVEMGIIDLEGGEIYQTLILPDHPELLNVPRSDGKKPSDVSGITPEMLVAAPRFPDVYDAIYKRLYGKHWIAYGAEFDERLLRQDCQRHEELEIISESATCIMLMYAKFRGEWSIPHNGYGWATLEKACEEMEITLDDPLHRSTGDARRTMLLLKAIADSELPSAIPF